MSRTVLGSVYSKSGRNDEYAFLETKRIATATSIDVYFGQYQSYYKDIHIVITNIEKPDAANEIWNFFVSTNGASVESVNAYTSVLSAQTASTAIVATGLINTGGIILGGNSGGMTAHALATATGKGGGILRVFFPDCNATTRPQWAWNYYYTNSASSAVETHGTGVFASGPLRGFSFQGNGNNFSCVANIYGVGRRIA